ncbi:MAG: phosphoglycerate mutase (2,3-diphosphoglycerate-independent) [Candidatus Yanofskybacteria bacterium RIFCSPLOWO2_01_FULL_49_25]|uniref:2,3-bisphosphoglycerate-independent phosphoglycerate mutase n=1 Tax=Candidatus Yanofskybacteria bacterium RIFCSPLOWO2_01_FULL_49_25 TaxID=1802701 RepID=A0A1F8GZE9_9BACT|nr:MAG: phosphoglycerate mutase (2,3-diphosphoglycerate-independent) [Candidatus Yanofskybacteria bacterium RIFCSPLOWO2_01_FULL_49_25]
MKHPYKKVLLIILDGFGLAPAGPSNAILKAGMTYLNSLIDRYTAYSLIASGLIVGLPWGKFGNSEVGHSAIGTGRILVQDWARINTDIKQGVFLENPALIQALDHCKKNNSALHIVGCFSPGGIHSHEDHLFAILNFAAKNLFSNVFLHLITDGEDAAPTESLASLERLEPLLKKSGARIASVIGRSYGMDRVFNWDLTEQAWKVMVKGEGPTTENVREYLQASHAKKQFDDEIIPAVVTEKGTPIKTIASNDAVIFFNFRNDRMKQLVASFTLGDEFTGFTRKDRPENLFIVTMTRYSVNLSVQAIAYDIPAIANTLSDLVSQAGMKQVRIAEKEKEAHVTNFFNGGRLEPNQGETRMIMTSKQIKGNQIVDYPAMSAADIVKTVIEQLEGDASLYVINFANADMTAHTGKIDATIKGLQVIDESLKQIIEKVRTHDDYVAVITCDHGNSEELLDPLTGGPDTQHSTNNVPVIFIAKEFETASPGNNLEALADEKPMGSLIDIAPSVLVLLGLPKPKDMTGSSLI